MLRSSCSPGGRLRWFLPLVTSVVLLAGCDSSSSKTADFPELAKKSKMTPTIPKAPTKGMDRVGSEAATP
jgi:hypothetical protein